MAYRVLVTAVGGDIGQSVARILAHLDSIGFVLGTDINPDTAGVYFVNKFELVPHATVPTYLDTMVRLAEQYSIDCIIPTSEAEIEVFNRFRGRTKQVASSVLMTNGETIDVCFDKFRTIEFLRSNRIDVPWTRLIADEPLGYPCVFKSRYSYRAKFTGVLEDRHDWEYHREESRDAIVQELLLPHDAEYTCGVYRGPDEETRSVILKRRLQNDVTGVAEAVKDEAIELLCLKVAEALFLRGSINIQLRKTALGPRIFEINPRLSSTVLFRHYINFCDMIWSLEDALNVKLIDRNRPIKYGTKMFRYYSEVFCGEDGFARY